MEITIMIPGINPSEIPRTKYKMEIIREITEVKILKFELKNFLTVFKFIIHFQTLESMLQERKMEKSKSFSFNLIWKGVKMVWIYFLGRTLFLFFKYLVYQFVSCIKGS